MYIAGDLHLAATVGKMLLEKNGDLEMKLTRLQQVAEQTAQENEASVMGKGRSTGLHVATCMCAHN